MSHKPTGQNAVESQIDALEAGHEDSLDAYFKLLSNQRRRHVFDCLREYATPIALADLADEVAVREYDAPITEISAEEVKEIYISLHHAHIPRIEDAGLVEYDQENDLVVLLEEGQEILEEAP